MATTMRSRRRSGGKPRANFLLRYILGNDGRPRWPDHVAIHPVAPPARVEGDAMLATWVGHASVLVQTQGINILTDPVWSRTVGPLGIGPGRVAEPGIAFEKLPKIDLVLVSHDHYDHMDLATLKKLWDRDHPTIVTSLGNDSVIGQTGVRATALDWGGRVTVRPGAEVIVTRNHHWGSRWGSDRNRALWSSFVVRLPGGNLFFAGDTGAGDLKWADEAARLWPGAACARADRRVPLRARADGGREPYRPDRRRRSLSAIGCVERDRGALGDVPPVL